MFEEIPDEQNPEELLKRIKQLEAAVEVLKERSLEIEAGVTRMATYQGVLHVLKGA